MKIHDLGIVSLMFDSKNLALFLVAFILNNILSAIAPKKMFRKHKYLASWWLVVSVRV